MIIGKIVGVVLGIPFGVFGVFFGLIAGTLVDRVLLMRRISLDIESFYLKAQFIPRIKRYMRPAAAIGLINSLMAIDDVGSADLEQYCLDKIQDFFHIPGFEYQRLKQFWDFAERMDGQIDIDWLIRIYGVSSAEYLELSEVYSYGGEQERDFLFGLFHYVAGSDAAGLSREEFRCIRNVFEPMGMAPREIQERLRAVPYLNREYCSMLGLNAECSEQELKKRYRELAARFHPDSSVNIGYPATDSSGESESSQDDFIKLQHAYEELLWQFRYYD